MREFRGSGFRFLITRLFCTEAWMQKRGLGVALQSMLKTGVGGL